MDKAFFAQVVYNIASRWHMLKVVNLEINHRQEGDKAYADLLNRLRTNSQTAEDVKMLKKRVFKRNHPIYKEVVTYIVCTKKTAKRINDEFLEKAEGDEMMFKAIHSHALQESYEPKIDEVGEVGNTGYMDELKVKVGCKVILIQNIDVADCLTNGQLGVLIGTVKAPNGSVRMLIVEFKNKNAGKEWRERNPGDYLISSIFGLISLRSSYSSLLSSVFLQNQFRPDLTFISTDLIVLIKH